MKMLGNFRAAPGYKPATLPRPGRVSPDKPGELEKHLVPEIIERKTYRFDNNYGALVHYYRETHTYDVDTLQWIGNQHIFVDGSKIITTHKEDIISTLHEIKNLRGATNG